jgi:glycosyltransferase involved in cell wall biosynthesis
MHSPERPRVLHVLGSLNCGGLETWLLHVLRNAPADGWSSEFLLHRTSPGAYDREVRALGAVLRYMPRAREPITYTHTLRRLLHAFGPYDVVHSHVHFYSGIVVRAAALARVPVRIAHSHTTEPPRGRGYGVLMRHLIQRHSTHRLAISGLAAEVLFGSQWQADPAVQLHDIGIDFRQFADLPCRAAAKQKLGLPRERFVIGHVGRFVETKNQAFLLDVFAKLIERGLDAHLLLVGAGPLEADVREQAAALGVRERCTFAGTHNDITRFYAAFDLFVFPSKWEGFGLAPLEAEAAGVPVLASTAVPSEATVVPGLVHHLPLEDGADAWARTAQQILNTNMQNDRRWSAGLMASSRFGIEHSVRKLADVYRSSRRANAVSNNAAA